MLNLKSIGILHKGGAVPKTFAELKDNALAWAMCFIVAAFAAGFGWQHDKISNLSQEFVRLERYQADQALYRGTLQRIESNIDKLLLMTAKGGL